ncbi:AEC family transporter [Sinanaerobacter chloroacetimidivorans]|jgi:predicted permease|uniref:AEC family transporter n=1 Tax=Sinanaerobacter chloroacetimidivorans TaxID=2818044 RepID=A0A8J7W1Q5_9FIRM|nr:AEC family transporter [Sinanaerobacter chloroacetimidivorans]MBR0597585.1 AEC family transporter [Sinanaerobacter chloroacetimidivorans]
MENLIISFNAVIPMFIWMVLGYCIRLRGLLSETSQSQVNNLVFKVFMPTLLFYNIYKTDIDMALQPKLMFYIFGGILLMWLLAILIGVKAEKYAQKRGAMIQGMFRSNFILFGLPLVINLFGTEGAGITSMAIAIVVPAYNILSVITLELFRGCRISIREVLAGIVKNPLIIASFIGMGFLFLKIPIPYFLESAVSGLADIATPLALVIMGAAFQITVVKENSRNLILSIIVKLAVMPLIFVTSAIFTGFRNIELATIMIVFAAPTAVASFPMAKQMGSDADLASEIIAFTTLISCFTIFLWIFVLKQIGLI